MQLKTFVTSTPFYEYLEDRMFDGPDDPVLVSASNNRRRKTVALFEVHIDENNEAVLHIPSIQYGMHRAEELERLEHYPPEDGVWGINYIRCERFWGSVDEETFPYGVPIETVPVAVESRGKRRRIHHYKRVYDILSELKKTSLENCSAFARKHPELREVIFGDNNNLNFCQSISVTLEITRDWIAPPGGIIDVSGNSEIIGTHAICIDGYSKEKGFTFQNWWGKEWGDFGRGYLSEEFYAQHVIESQYPVGVGYIIPDFLGTGIVCRSWKERTANYDGIFGEEIIDTSNGERLAWAFAVKRNGFVEVEEFFVWPSYRNRGYAHVLANRLKYLSKVIRLPIKILVSWGDCSRNKISGVEFVAKLLGVRLQPSSNRLEGLVGIPEDKANRFVEYTSLKNLKIPAKPTVFLDSLRTCLYKVWFGTNRQPIDCNNPNKGFGPNRSSQEIYYGSCKVFIPRSHQIGRTKPSWWKRLFFGDSDQLKLRGTPKLVSSENFIKDIQNSLGTLENSDSLLFLHGYNVTFEQAAIQTAQLGCDLKIPGISAFFSWPSQGTLMGYQADEATIESSESSLNNFLSLFSEAVMPGRVHIIAHSMGNRGLLRVFQRLFHSTENQFGIKFGQIFLAAPDVDADVFNDLVLYMGERAQRVTLYVSPTDLALRASQFLHGAPRAGFCPPVTTSAGVDTVYVPKFNLLDLGHSYYAEAKPLLCDMHALIQNNSPPDARFGLRQSHTEAQEIFWEMIE